MHFIIKRPVITEKTLTLASRGWYTFAVDSQAEKPEVARAIAAHYGVEVVAVRSITMHGKMRRTGRRAKPTKKPDWKKVMVHLKSGQTIDAFEVTGQQEEKPVKEKPVEKGK